MNILLLMMGGSGIRLGGDIPKQYIEIDNIPIFCYILNKYNELSCIDKIIVVSNKDYLDFVKSWVESLKLTKVVKIVPGGDNRSESVLNGLTAANEITTDANILIHDATHPYVDEEGTKKIIDKLNDEQAVTLVACNYDTVYEIENDTVVKVIDRKRIVAGASPEAFKLASIYNIYKKATPEELAKMTSAGAIAIDNGIDLKIIETDYLNLKITFKRDLELFKKLVKNYYFIK